MFDLLTILSLVAPAILAPLACAGFLHFIGRAESARRTSPIAAPAARIVLDSPTPPLAAEPVAERHVA